MSSDSFLSSQRLYLGTRKVAYFSHSKPELHPFLVTFPQPSPRTQHPPYHRVFDSYCGSFHNEAGLAIYHPWQAHRVLHLSTKQVEYSSPQIASGQHNNAQPLVMAKRGDKALQGEEEYLPSHYFDEAEETRWLTGRGDLIMIYDPTNVEGTTKRYTTVDALEIPPGHVVEVMRAWVKITTTK